MIRFSGICLDPFTTIGKEKNQIDTSNSRHFIQELTDKMFIHIHLALCSADGAQSSLDNDSKDRTFLPKSSLS